MIHFLKNNYQYQVAAVDFLDGTLNVNTKKFIHKLSQENFIKYIAARWYQLKTFPQLVTTEVCYNYKKFKPKNLQGLRKKSVSEVEPRPVLY